MVNSTKIKSDENYPAEATGIKNIFRALRYRNYRLFFGGQSISLIGTWMQQVAMGWLVYRLTNSAFLLGLVGFAGQLPVFIFAPFMGVLSDRWNRHRVLIGTQASAMIQAALLTILSLTEYIQVWHIIILSILLGLINSLDAPTRQSFVIDMVEKKEDLGNAIALNSSMFNSARLIGPSIAGIIISISGEWLCFLLNAISYLAVIISLLVMNITPRKIEVGSAKILHNLKEGFSYAFASKPIRTLILLLGLVSLMGMPYVVLMPIIAKDILHGGPHTLGFLMASAGIGALTAAIYLASRRSVRGLVRIIPMAAGAFGFSLFMFSLSRYLPLSLGLMMLIGFGMMMQIASSNTVLQTIVDDDKRGRVMSFYTMAFMGTAPFGSLLAGSLASKIGAPHTIMIGGVLCILGAIIFARNLPSLRRMIRPIYIQKGVIPAMPSGLGTGAAEISLPPKD